MIALVLGLRPFKSHRLVHRLAELEYPLDHLLPQGVQIPRRGRAACSGMPVVSCRIKDQIYIGLREAASLGNLVLGTALLKLKGRDYGPRGYEAAIPG